MTFAWAKVQMANGARVRRAAWAGRYLYFDRERQEFLRVTESTDAADLIGEPVGVAEPWKWTLDPDRFAEDWEVMEGAPVGIVAPPVGRESLL
jgi:hypothetical protein